MPRPLYRRHDPAGRTRYEDLKQLARTQARVLHGTPGTLKLRTKSGNRYWVREYIRVDGKKTDDYVGAEAATPRKTVDDLKATIALAAALALGSGKLRLLGYQRIDRKPAAVLEVFYNHGLHRAGLVLVGSHAYGVLLNELGIEAPGYRTQDLDVARASPLQIALPEGLTFERLLRETSLDFQPVPGMPSHRPSASFKLPGAEALAVDLLVPGDEAGRIVPADELRAHAQAVPLLDFLVDDAIDAVMLSPNQVIPVKVPSPERFVVHKLFASQSRRADRGKVRKDLEQAALLAAALEEDTPGTVADTFRRLPAPGRPAARRGAGAAATILRERHPDAEALLLRLAKR